MEIDGFSLRVIKFKDDDYNIKSEVKLSNMTYIVHNNNINPFPSMPHAHCYGKKHGEVKKALANFITGFAVCASFFINLLELLPHHQVKES